MSAAMNVFVTLATSPEKIVWAVLLYAGIQVVENVVLVPRIQSHAVGIHPAIIMVALMIGSETAGLWGVLLAVPVSAVGRDVFKYFHQEWSEPVPPSESSPEDEEAKSAEDSSSSDGSPDASTAAT